MARAAVLVAGLTGVSQVTGLLRDVVVAATFGAGRALDAYLVSQGATTLLLAVVAGALTRAAVPTVSRAVAEGQVERAHRTVRTLLTVAVLVLLGASAVVAALAGPLVALLAPGFDATTAQLAVRLTRITVGATVLVAVTDLLAGYAQAHGRFVLAGVAGVPFNLAMVVAAAVLGPLLGVEALAVGFAVGSAARLLLLVVAARGVGLRLVPRLRVREPDVLEVLRLVPPLLVVTALSSIGTLTDRAVGSAFGDGAVTVLNLAWRTVSLVESLLVLAVLTAVYPVMSAAAGRADRAALRALVSRSTGLLALLVGPAVVLLLVVPVPVVALLFGRGAFDQADVRATASAVVLLAVGVPALALSGLWGRACLAVGDSRGPAVAAVVATTVNVVGDLTVGRLLGVTGIAASTSASFVVAAVLVGARVRWHHHALSGALTLPALLRTGTAAAVAGAAATLVLVPLGSPEAQASAAAVLQVLVAAGTVAAVYAAVLLVLRSPELAQARGSLRRGARSRQLPDLR